jgi:hypothetical protein
MKTRQIHVQHGVPVHHQKFAVELLKDAERCTCRALRLPVIDAMHIESPVLPRGAVIDYLVGGMIDEDEDVGKTMLLGEQDLPLQQRQAADVDQGFG